MESTSRRHRALTTCAGLFLLAGVVAVTEVPAAAATCPTLDSARRPVPAAAPSVDWSGCNLTGANLVDADLTGANLSGAVLTNADLTGAVLTGANMTGSSLVKARVTNAAMGGTDLASAALTGVKSGGVTGTPALPTGWKVIHGYLIGKGADLRGANLAGQNLKPADLRDVDFSGADLTGANLSQTTAAHASFIDAILTSANLSSADFTYADMTRSKVNGANVNAAKFAHAIFTSITSGGLVGSATSVPENWTQGAGYFVYASGLLRVTTSPAVPARIYVDGFQRDTWGLNWLKIAAGTHEVCFGAVAGFDTPDCQTITVNVDLTTTVTGSYTERGYLHVSTSPAVPAQISIDSIPRDNWGVYTDVAVGDHLVCFASLEGLTPPPCQWVTVTAGQTTEYSGTFTHSGVSGLEDVGYLRVTTSPAVPAQIVVDGEYRDTWGLNWLAIDPGAHSVCFTDMPGFARPACQSVTVTDNVTTSVTGVYTAQGYLKVETSPALPATLYVDGVRMNDWGVYTDLPLGVRQICFGDVVGYLVPSCTSATVTAGATTTVTGSYPPYIP